MCLQLSWAIAFFATVSVAQAFTFSSNEPTQCDLLTVNWTGGQEPYQLELVPIYGSQRLFPISNSSYSNGQGSFQTQLAFPKGQRFMMVMSDNTGYGTGGVSDVLTVGASVGGKSCNTTDPGVAFSFQLNSALQQCSPYTFSDYTGAVQPVRITAMIPGGDSFVIKPPQGSSSYQWTADVAAGTSLVFIMTDSQGRVGGSSDLLQVATSNDNSCLASNSPSSTANPPSAGNPTSSSAPAVTTTISTSTPVSGATIAGTIVGALIALAVLVTLGLFFLRKRNRGSPYGGQSWRSSRPIQSVDLSYDPARTHDRQGSNIYPYHNSSSGSVTTPMEPSPHFLPSDQYEPSPFILPPVSPAPTRHDFDANPDTPGDYSGSGPSNRTSMSSAGRRKAAMAGVTVYKPSRFIMHTDAEEMPPHEEEEIVELPPQYTDRRQTGFESLPSRESPAPS